MNILITGGAGYIGSVLTEKLLDQGHYVTIVDNFTFGANSIFHMIGNGNLNIIKCDVRDIGKYEKILSATDIFIPLAALVGAPLCDQYPTAALEVNYEIIKKQIGKLRSDQLVIYPNTNSGYGQTDGTSFCTEDSPLKPISLYGTSKKQAEDVIVERDNSIVFRLATVFGSSPRPRFDLIVNNFVSAAVLNKLIVVFQGGFLRNYVAVDDVADAFIFMINKYKGTQSSNIYNLGNDSENRTKLELAELIASKIAGTKVISGEGYVDLDNRNYKVSSEKLKKAGFTPQMSISNAIDPLRKLVALVEIKNGNY